MSLLNLRNVESGYGQLQILWGIDLDVQAGETVILLGSNSAGKSTLLRTLIGLLPCWNGDIEFEGQPIQSLPTHERIKKGIGYMSELAVFPDLTIDENIRLGGYFMSRAEVRRGREELFELFPDLAGKRRDLASSLSGGQRKMLGIAKVLVAKPKLLLMDEPSSGLAPVFVKQVIEALRTAIGGGMALLLAEQDIAFLSLADRGFLIEGGRVRLSGTRSELENSDVVREAYFGLEGASPAG